MFSQALVMKQQGKTLWTVSEPDVTRGVWFGVLVWFFSFFPKGEETEDLL